MDASRSSRRRWTEIASRGGDDGARTVKVLHLFSNSKWTGPAEPALNLCAALRREGIETEFACAPGARVESNRVVVEARARGIEPILSMRLPKYRNPLVNPLDVRRLRRLLKGTRYDIVHCHLDNDHRIAVAAGAPHIVRSSYHGEGFRYPSRQRKLFWGTSFLIEPSQAALEHDLRLYGFPPDRAAVAPGAIDVDRFDPKRSLSNARAELGIPPDAFVVGIVARMQLHRHFEDLWEATHQLAAEFPKLHVVVVGRGTNEEIVGRRPVRQLGLEHVVHFAGFRSGDDFLAALAAFDVKVFLVPGTDGTCRAVREAMAMGKPAIVARRGMLPEIVRDGETGIVFDNSPESLAVAIRTLITNRSRVRTMGTAARRLALAQFSLEAHANTVRNIYEKVLAALPRA